jgi:hypothetical protein
MPLGPNKSRCSFHLLPSVISRWDTRIFKTWSYRVSFAVLRQASGPEPIQLQLSPQPPGQSARTSFNVVHVAACLTGEAARSNCRA